MRTIFNAFHKNLYRIQPALCIESFIGEDKISIRKNLCWSSTQNYFDLIFIKKID